MAATASAATASRDRAALRTSFRVLQAIIWVLLIAIAVLLVVGALAPLTLGYRSFVVTSGSMEPTILTGSLAVDETISPARLQPGDVITFRSTTGEQQLI